MKNRVSKMVNMDPTKTKHLLFASGDTVPTDADTGYATGCLFQHTDGGVATALYVNEGDEDSCDFNPTSNDTSVLLGATAGVVTASVAVIVDANKDAGDFRNLDCQNLDAGASGSVGTVDIFPTTGSKGKLILSCDDQDGNTNVTLKPAAMAQATVVSIPDPGAATANVLLTSQANDKARVTATAAELSTNAGVTAGTVLASGTCVAGASKDLGDFRNLDCQNLDAGADAVAGTVDIFPTTTGSGKLILSCDDQDGATNVTVKAAGMAQASTISFPDPGNATAYVVLSSQANDQARVTATNAELSTNAGVTAGTVAASKTVVVDGSKDVGDFRNLDCQNLDAGADAVAGTVDIFPATTARGKFILSCDDQDAATNVTFKPAPMVQAAVVSIPDPGAATANVMLTSAVNDQVRIAATQAEIDVLSGVTAGTVAVSKGVVVDGSKDVGDFRNLDCQNLDAGADAVAGTVDIFPATTARGKFILSCDDQDAATNVTFKPAPMVQAAVVSIPDPGAATANVMLTSAANDQVVVAATAPEIDVLASVTAGTSVASKGLVLNASGTLTAGPLVLDDMTEGSGITGLVGGVIAHSVRKIGGLIKTEIFIDLTGLNDGGTPADIIGKDGGAANCHIGQITAAKNGTIYAGMVTVFETPAGGNADIDIWQATEATGAQDAPISGLTEDKLFDGDTLNETGMERLPFQALPGADKYLYLVNGAATDADYTAGKILIEFWGA